MKTKHKTRLLELANFLDTLPPEHFDFGTWGKQTSCGSVGCALGWATTLPFAKKQGVGMQLLGPGSNLGFTIDNRQALDFEVSELLFDLDADETRRLFMFKNEDDWGDGTSGLPKTATASEVATHIRTWVSEHS